MYVCVCECEEKVTACKAQTYMWVKKLAKTRTVIIETNSEPYSLESGAAEVLSIANMFSRALIYFIDREFWVSPSFP